MYNPILFNDEIFKDIIVYNIAPYYKISNYGTVINKFTGKQISMQIDSWGYLRVALYTIDNVQKSFSVHRLVMMTFHPIDNPELFEVNHLKGIKSDNRDVELEWTTHSENMLHAYKTGLNNNIRENNFNSVMKEDEVRYICESLQKGIPFIEIASSLPETNSSNIIDIIRAIYTKKSWTSISCNYRFHDYGDRKHSMTESEVRSICKLMESGYTNSEITSMIGYGNDYKDPITRNMRTLIGSIRNGKCYSEISSDYSFNLPSKKKHKIFSDEQVHLICKSLENGLSADDILSKLGLDSTNVKEKELFKKIISAIKHKTRYTNISINYKF